MAEVKKQRNKKARAVKKHRKDEPEIVEPEQDEWFAYIVGYTPAGFPYGLTWEEAKELPEDTETDISNDDLPF